MAGATTTSWNPPASKRFRFAQGDVAATYDDGSAAVRAQGDRKHGSTTMTSASDR